MEMLHPFEKIDETPGQHDRQPHKKRGMPNGSCSNPHCVKHALAQRKIRPYPKQVE